MAENNSPGYIEAVASSKRKSKENLRVDQLIPSEILESSGEDGIKLLLEKYYEFMNINEFVYTDYEDHTDLVLDGIARFRIKDENGDNNEFFTDETGNASTLIISSPNEFLPRAVTFDGASSSVIVTSNNTINLSFEDQSNFISGAPVKYLATGPSIQGLTSGSIYYIIYSFRGEIRLSDSKGGSEVNLQAVASAGGTHTLVGISNNLEVNLKQSDIFITNGNELPGSLQAVESDIGKTFTVVGLDQFNGLSAVLTTPITNWVGPGPSYILNSIEDAMDIDKNSNSSIDPTNQYLEMMQREIASAIPRNISSTNVNKNTLYKRIVDFYKIRGSTDSIETFFRLLFNEPVKIEKPYDNTLIPSSGDWSGDTNQFVSRKGFVSEKKIRLHDSYRYQKYSYLIKTGINLTEWDNVFTRLVHPSGFIFFGEILLLLENVRNILGDGITTKGVMRESRLRDPVTNRPIQQFISAYGNGEDYGVGGRLTLSSMPGIQPGVIGIEDVPLLVEQMASTFGPRPFGIVHKPGLISAIVDAFDTITGYNIVQSGAGYDSAPNITISGGGGSNAAATAVLNSDGEIESVTVDNVGSGYTSFPNIIVDAPTDGQGNNLISTLSHINVSLLPGKKFKKAPAIYIDPPTARDENDEPLATNIQATAKFIMNSVGISSVRVKRGGSSYTDSPFIQFSNPEETYTGPQLWGEDFSSSSATSSMDPNADDYEWNYSPGHVASIDSANGELEINTTSDDSSVTYEPRGVYLNLDTYEPAYFVSSQRPQANVVKLKIKARGTTATDVLKVKVFNAPSGVGSYWQYFSLSTTSATYEYEYYTDMVYGDDILIFQSSSNDTVYVEDISAERKYDYPRATASLADNGDYIDGIRIDYPGSGYVEMPTIAFEAVGTHTGQIPTIEIFKQDAEIASVAITNPGHGYIVDPDVRVGSSMEIEDRVREDFLKLIISLNHLADGSSIINSNSYYSNKGNSYYNSSKKFDFNQTIEQFGDQTIESNNINDINKLNINSFISNEVKPTI